MISLLNQNKRFLLLYALFVLLSVLFLGTHHKGDEILFFNHHRFLFLDTFFTYCTQMAEFRFGAIVFVLLLFVRYQYAVVEMLLLFSITGVLNVLKQYVFGDSLRPSMVMGNVEPLHFAAGTYVLEHYSFPSGHTAAAFGLFFLLTLFLGDKRFGIFFFLLALLVGISRMYLLQHFLSDVLVGSFVGLIMASIFYTLYHSICIRRKRG